MTTMDDLYQCDERMLELVVRVLYDYRPPKLNIVPDQFVVYLFSETKDNQESSLEKVIVLRDAGGVSRITLCDGDTNHGYPGFAAWKEYLVSRGVPEGEIMPVASPVTQTSANTLTEAQALVRAAKELGWSELVIIAPPFHQVRCFITMVSVLFDEYPELKVYNEVGVSLPWSEKVRHSQGVLQATRSELIHTELERIERYHEKGDLVSPETALAYLRARDR